MSNKKPHELTVMMRKYYWVGGATNIVVWPVVKRAGEIKDFVLTAESSDPIEQTAQVAREIQKRRIAARRSS